MPIAKFQLPDGKVARFEVPEGTTPEQAQTMMEQYFTAPQQQPTAQAATAPQEDNALLGLRVGGVPVVDKNKTFGDYMSELGRGLAQTGSGIVEGAFELGDTLLGPAAYLANKAGLSTQPMAATVRQGAGAVGVPEPANAIERVQKGASKVIGSTAATMGIGGPLSQAQNLVARGVGASLKTAPVKQAISAASAGTAGAVAKENDAGPWGQLGATILGGLAGYTGAQGAERITNSVKSAIANLSRKKATMAEVTVQLNQILKDNGITLGQVPFSVRQSISEEMKKAMDAGKEINSEALRRIADYGAVGATPTKGRVTLNPADITREANLSKLGINSTDPELHVLGNIARQNDMRLIQGLNELGAGSAMTPDAAGGKLATALREVDAPRKAAVDAAYQAVRDSQGRAANLNTRQFSELANNALDEQQLGYFLPKEARNILNDISSGKTPFNVNTATQVDSVLSGAARDSVARGDGRAAAAINQVRKALQNTDIEPGAGQETMALYNQARQAAAQRFGAIEGSPAMKAALDDVAPDKFVQTYIIGGGGKANVRDVTNLAKELRQSPEAFNEARNQILAYLKNAATGGKLDETANVSPSGYSRALNTIGANKLKLFFVPEEVGQIRAIGRVASYEKFQPTGSAVNNSNTTGAAAAVLEKIASSKLLSRVPLSGAVQTPAQNWTLQLQTKEALSPMNALTAAAKNTPPINRNAMVPYATLPSLMNYFSNSTQQ
jgi:hypothetical protein